MADQRQVESGDLRERVIALAAAYDEEPHSEGCGIDACVRCVVDEFTALVASPTAGGEG